MGLLVFSMVVCVVAMGVGWGLAKRPGIEQWMLTVSFYPRPVGFVPDAPRFPSLRYRDFLPGNLSLRLPLQLSLLIRAADS
ncbi:MAG: hypothetical protein U0903_09315 [Planctomycetales bacterium]